MIDGDRTFGNAERRGGTGNGTGGGAGSAAGSGAGSATGVSFGIGVAGRFALGILLVVGSLAAAVYYGTAGVARQTQVDHALRQTETGIRILARSIEADLDATLGTLRFLAARLVDHGLDTAESLAAEDAELKGTLLRMPELFGAWVMCAEIPPDGLAEPDVFWERNANQLIPGRRPSGLPAAFLRQLRDGALEISSHPFSRAGGGVGNGSDARGESGGGASGEEEERDSGLSTVGLISIGTSVLLKDRRRCAVGVDLGLARLHEYTASIRLLDRGRLALVSNDALWISNPERTALLGRPIVDVEPAYADVAGTVRRGAAGKLLAPGPDGLESWHIFAPVAPGETFAPWAVLAVIPVADLLKPVTLTLPLLATGVIIIVGLTTLAAFLLARLLAAGPAERMRSVLRRAVLTRDYSAGPGLTRRDEMGLLAVAIDDMLGQWRAFLVEHGERVQRAVGQSDDVHTSFAAVATTVEHHSAAIGAILVRSRTTVTEVRAMLSGLSLVRDGLAGLAENLDRQRESLELVGAGTERLVGNTRTLASVSALLSRTAVLVQMLSQKTAAAVQAAAAAVEAGAVAVETGTAGSGETSVPTQLRQVATDMHTLSSAVSDIASDIAGVSQSMEQTSAWLADTTGVVREAMEATASAFDRHRRGIQRILSDADRSIEPIAGLIDSSQRLSDVLDEQKDRMRKLITLFEDMRWLLATIRHGHATRTEAIPDFLRGDGRGG